MSLPELLATADVVTVHVPLIEATRGMIGDAELAAMKPGAVLVQAARGGIVDEAALARHLASGHLGGTAVDVYSTEPPAADNPLLRLTGEAAEAASRLLLTPHIAGVTRQSSAFLFRSAWQNVERVMRGEPPLHRAY
jgi:phosphoglycerate dehydrogenase-like enzyme